MQIDFLDKTGREELQKEGLLHTVQYAYSSSSFYRSLFDRVGLKPEDVQEPASFNKVPFTTKSDLRGAYPYGMAAVPLEQIIRIHASSGTTGKPIVAGYTRRDLDDWANAVARICEMAGVSAKDIVQISFGYGLFTGGFGLHYGMERLGATVVPFSSGNNPLLRPLHGGNGN